MIWRKWTTDADGNCFDVIFPNDYFYEFVTSKNYTRKGNGGQTQAYVMSDLSFQDTDDIVCDARSVSNTYNMPLVCCSKNRYGLAITHKRNPSSSSYIYDRVAYLYVEDSNNQYKWKNVMTFNNSSNYHWCDGSVIPSYNGGFLIPKVYAESSGELHDHISVYNFTYNETTGYLEQNIIFDGYLVVSGRIEKSYIGGNNVSFVEDLSTSSVGKRYLKIPSYSYVNGICYYPISISPINNVLIDFSTDHSVPNLDDPFTDCALVTSNGFSSRHILYPADDTLHPIKEVYSPSDTDTAKYDSRYLKTCKEVYDIAFPKRILDRYTEDWQCSLLHSYPELVVDGEIKIRQIYKCRNGYSSGNVRIEENYLVNILVSINDTTISITECEQEGLPLYKEYIDKDGNRQITQNCLHTDCYKYDNKLYYYQYEQLNPVYKLIEGSIYRIETNPTYSLKLYSTTDNINFNIEKTFDEDISFTCMNRYFRYHLYKDKASSMADLSSVSSLKVKLYDTVAYTGRENAFYPEHDMLKDININSLSLGLFERISINSELGETYNRIHSQEKILKFAGSTPSVNGDNDFILKVKYEYADEVSYHVGR